ncbi:MAG: radical SAM protein [Candidatus Hydrogenedentes bacterium]|nr:radical SAM protein [Candidatus Hydrogenedentota bacterium]
MRAISAVALGPPRRLRSRIASTITEFVPIWVFRKLMEHKFINFGVETTNICNANCTFCGYRFMQRPKTLMPWEVYEKAVQEFAKTGGGLVSFTPTVGDPLVDKKMIERIEFANRFKEISGVFLFTNAILLHRFDLDRLLRSGLSRMAISTFIGDRKGYKRYYGKDKYNQVVRNIINIARRNRELGSPVQITLHLRVEGDKRSWYDTQIYKTIAELIGEVNISYLDSYDAWGGLIRKEDIPEGTALVQSLPVEVKMRSPCFELYRRVHILADGNVGACVCVDLEGEINIGNITEQSLDEIWHGEKLKSYRSEWVKGNLPNICRKCTRYQGVDAFITENRKRIMIEYLRRTFPRLLSRLTR